MLRTHPIAVFMAFGTKGDVHPIAAIAAAFSCDQEQYCVVFITHAAHESLGIHLATKNVEFVPVSSPPFLSPYEVNDSAGFANSSFSLKKRKIRREHRKECVSIVEGIFGDSPSMDGDLMVINFFALEGWSLAELFNVRCVVAAPYVVPYSAPSSFERQFREELPLLYEYFQQAPIDKDPVTGLPMWHDRSASPLLFVDKSLFGSGLDPLYVLSPPLKPDVGVQNETQFRIPRTSKEQTNGANYVMFSIHQLGEDIIHMKCCTLQSLCTDLVKKLLSALVTGPQMFGFVAFGFFLWNGSFHATSASLAPVFIGLSSVGSMGFIRKPQAFLHVLQEVLRITTYRFILFSTGYEPLDAAIRAIATEGSSSSEQRESGKDGISLFGGRLFCFSGTIPYSWLFPRCSAAIHHGGSGSTAAALHAGIPQVVCPFMMDQFYWGERMFWLGVGPEPLKRHHLIPDEVDEKSFQESANILARAIDYALSPEIKAHASEIAERLSLEDGVSVAVKDLKEELSSSKH